MSNNNFFTQPTQPGISEGPDNDALPIPKMIGPYKIESLLEKGGMSYLYLGAHPETHDPVIIKVLSPKFRVNPEAVQRFINEAEIIAMTDHPNIVKLFGHGEWAGGFYIAMEFIQGISLRQYIQQNPMSLKRALEMILEISYALCHLHTHGVIHRDLKPENILITELGVVKVIDFGIAQLLTDKPSESPSKRRLLGTPIYMSPEQREDPETVSYPSDIYSLGIISYELVLGKFSHGQIHIGLMPKGMQKILSKALQYKPEDRYQDIVDFISETTAYLNSATLYKDKKVSDQIIELSENLKKAQRILSPTLPQKWEKLKFGVSTYRRPDVRSVFYDFVEMPNQTYGIVMGESSSIEAEGIVHVALLRGMIRSLCQQTSRPSEIAALVNSLLFKDWAKIIFPFSLLTLYPNTHEFRYISCGYGNLWMMQTDKKGLQKLSTSNVALGIDSSAEFSDIAYQWNEKEVLLLTSLATNHDEDLGLSEQAFKQIITDIKHNALQKFVDSLLLKVKIIQPKVLDRAITMIALSSHSDLE